MKIYLDFVFLINFSIDFLLLFGTSKILKEVTPLKNLLLGSIVGSISLLLLFLKLNNLELFLLKIILSVLMILTTFKKKNFLKNITYFYLLSIILGGSLYLLDISFSYQQNGFIFVKNSYFLNFVIIIIIAPLIIYLFVKEHLNYKNIYSNHYVVEIYLNNKQYKLEGMLDTGNQLVDPYKKRAIILVDMDIDYTKFKFIYVPYKALNIEGVIPCISPDRVIIKDKIFSNCLIGLSKDKFSLQGANCILPNQFKEDL